MSSEPRQRNAPDNEGEGEGEREGEREGEGESDIDINNGIDIRSEAPSGASTDTPSATLHPGATVPAARPQTALSATSELTAKFQERDAQGVEATVVALREAWRRGDQSGIAEALISQAMLLEAAGARLLSLAGNEKKPAAIQMYANLALRALEQSRKALATLAELSAKPHIQNNLQINLSDRPNEKFVSDAPPLDR